MSNYVMVADLILKGEWRDTHFFQPIGFPLLLVFLKTITSEWARALGLIQVLASTLTLWLTWKASAKAFGEKVGLLSLGVLVLHLPFIVFSGLALAETMFIFFLSLLLWLTLKLVNDLDWKYSIAWGLVFFVAFLFKGTHIFYVPMLLLAVLKWKRKEALKSILLVSITVWTGLISHGLFTSSKIGKFQLSASAGGLNFVEGKCPLKNNADSAGYSWLSPLYYQLGMTKMKKWDRPFTDSSYFFQQGLNCIADRPVVLIESLEGIPFLFMGNFLWPSSHFKNAFWMRLYEMLFAIFSITGLMIFLFMFSPQVKSKENLIIWILPILSVCLCVYIFKSEIRFRIPFDVWIIPVAIKGWVELFRMKTILRQQL